LFVSANLIKFAEMTTLKENVTISFEKLKGGEHLKIIKWLDDNFEEYVLMSLLVMITTVMMLQIVMRYVFNASLSWPEELTRYCFVWSTFIGISYSIKKGSMLKIDAILGFMPKKVQQIIEIMTQVIVLIFFGYLLVNSIDVVEGIYKSGQTSPAMNIPMYIIYSCTVAGFSLAVLRSIQVLQGKFKQLFSGNEFEENVETDTAVVVERG